MNMDEMPRYVVTVVIETVMSPRDMEDIERWAKVALGRYFHVLSVEAVELKDKL